MILKFSICGLFILLIVVLTVTYYSQLEGFDNMDACAGVTDTTPASKVPISCMQQLWTQNQCSLPTLPANVYLPDAQKQIGDMITKGNVLTQDVDKSIGNFGMMKTFLAGFISNPKPNSITCLGPATPATTPATKPATPIPATGSDLSKGSSIVPPSGAGPAPIVTKGAAAPMEVAHAAASPQRNDIQSHVALSDTGYHAMDLKQKSDLLSSIQKMFRNELLASRSTDSSTIDPASCASSASSSTQQGNEYMSHDMSKYIKKDSIPCYGCALDY